MMFKRDGKTGEYAMGSLGFHSFKNVGDRILPIARRIVGAVPFIDHDAQTSSVPEACQVLFINGADGDARRRVSARIARHRERFEKQGLVTRSISLEDLSLAEADAAAAIVFCLCGANGISREVIVRAHGRGRKVFYDADELAFSVDYLKSVPLRASETACDRLAAESLLRSREDLLELCDGAIAANEEIAEGLARFCQQVFIVSGESSSSQGEDTHGEDGDELRRALEPTPRLISDIYDCSAGKGIDAVASFLEARGFSVPSDEQVDAAPWNEVSFESRVARIDAALEAGKRVALLVYERTCGDDATFRYYGANISERLASSNEWDAVYCFLDEIDRISEWALRVSLVVLIRMRIRPDLAHFANIVRGAGIPLAYFIDDNVLGAPMAERVARAMVQDSSSEFEKNFWFGAAMRFELASQLCDCFLASTAFLANVLSKRYGKPAFVIGPSLNDAQVQVAEAIEIAPITSDQQLVIGYFSGTASHREDFDLVRKPLLSFIDAYPGVRLLLVGEFRLDDDLIARWRSGSVVVLPRVSPVMLQWLQAAVDVVLAPLVLDDFTKAKSALKVFEAGAVGTPACASPSPSYSEAVERIGVGELCSTEQEWLDALECVYENRMDRTARMRIRDHALENYYGEAVRVEVEAAFNEAVHVESSVVEALDDETWDFSVSDWNDAFEVNEKFGKTARGLPISEGIAGGDGRAAALFGVMKSARAKVEREGVKAASDVVKGRVRDKHRAARKGRRNPEGSAFHDVLFVNGCSYALPHPIRYRVDHQVEQLQAFGLSVDRVDAWNLRVEQVASARSFIFFRCPYSSELGDFVALAKRLNKRVYFDIDDLVVDGRYTDAIEFLGTMSDEERAGYDSGVDAMGRMLRTCGNAITTTDRLASELKTIVPNVFINRNTASEDMLFYSNRAVYERDVLPFMKEQDVPASELVHWRWAKKKHAMRDAHGVSIGYFSGSITHNDDIALIIPALVEVLESRPSVRLCIAGLLDIPGVLEPYRDRIVSCGFQPWERLPDAIADVDINIAPLCQSIFNEAKSENKWIEAALVKVPTVASDIGAFSKVIDHGKTGLLCRTVDEWIDALIGLIDNPLERVRMGEAAWRKCTREHVTIRTGHGLAKFLADEFTRNVFIVLPGLRTSGGVLVALKHCAILQRAGFDVTIVDDALEKDRYAKPFVEVDGHLVPVIHGKSYRNKDEGILIQGSVDQMVATMWPTLSTVERCGSVRHKRYLVQGYETELYEPPAPQRSEANATYVRDGIEYLTISRWCKGWLESDFGQSARYAPNGLDLKSFPAVERLFTGERKIRILIEGDPHSYYKNVDEAFGITNELDPDKFEVWHLSYNAGPKEYYRVDRVLNQIPHEEVGSVYASCDILLKTSLLESFSYPPLEMMATGGFVIAVPNEGNREYLVHGKNCLLFDSGDKASALACIDLLVQDSELRARLRKGGLETASARDWSAVESDVIALYDVE